MSQAKFAMVTADAEANATRDYAFMDRVTVVEHPLVQHKLTLLRDKTTSDQSFRMLLRETATLLCYEMMRDFALERVPIETPLMRMEGRRLAGPELVFVPILRAGLGFLDGMLALVPQARVAHVGVQRDPRTLEAIEYYFKAPARLSMQRVIVIDPMLATGHSAVAALDRLRDRGAADMGFVCLLAAPEGIDHVQRHHPSVHIWTAAIDPRLDDHGYIVPGLGDAGDRLYGTA